ncbi:MAG: hypothetical protein NTX25_18785 [Proteobacteria bacterium]|nr:hypothetical protein [Pseudomonadota bacterium]
MKSFGLSHFILLGLSFWLTACASYTDEVKDVIHSYRSGQYQQALKKLDESSLKDQTRNRLLFTLERAMILDREGQRDESRKLLIKADKYVDELYTTSISKTAASFLYNDAATDYPGEDYEKVAIHTMLAHSYLEEGQLNEARVEAAKINSRLNEINGFYETNKNRYKEDAYARYLAGMIYEALGEYDSAIVDYKSALRIYEGDYNKIFGVPAPEHLVEALYHLYLRRNRNDDAKELKSRYKLPESKLDSKIPYGEIVVLHEVSGISPKERKEFILPIGKEIIRFSFPVIAHVKRNFGRTGVKLDDETTESADIVQNHDAIARETLEDRRGRILAKSAARLILKSQMTQKAEKEWGPLGWLAGNLYGALTETADTRSWNLLPAAIEVSRIQVKPGAYNLTIYNDGRTSRLRQVKVKAGSLEIIRDY